MQPAVGEWWKNIGAEQATYAASDKHNCNYISAYIHSSPIEFGKKISPHHLNTFMIYEINADAGVPNYFMIETSLNIFHLRFVSLFFEGLCVYIYISI